MPLTTSQVQTRLRGVAAGLLTPFDGEGSIEYSKIRENARSLHGAGIRTFLATANISEYHSLSQSERVNVAEAARDALPSDACILAGVGGSTSAARELVQSYERIGVDAAMVMPPDHTYIHEQGLLRYYKDIANGSDIPLVPYVRGFDPSVEYLADLTTLDEVIGIKYALEDPVKLGAGIEAGEDDVVWVNGLAEPFAVSFWAEGVEGFSAGVSNFRPEVGLELYDALKSEDWEHARRLRNACLPYQNLREETGLNNSISGAISVPVVKKGLELAGLHGGHVREPIEPLSDADAARAERLYQELDQQISELVS